MAQPKLRFKREDGTEFPEWEDKCIGSIAVVKVGEKPSLVLGEASNFEYINAGTTNSGYTTSFNCEGDTVTTPSRGQGGIGYVGYQSKEFWLGPLCYKIKSNDITTMTKYIFYVLTYHSSLISDIKKVGSIPAINREDLIQIALSFPCLEEQQKIVDFLSNIDEVIVQSEAEVQNLEQQKKVAMQKIFSQEVRFRRDDGMEYPEWETNSLSELCDYADYRGKTPTKTQNGIFLVTAKNIKQGYIDYEISKEYIAEADYETVMHRGVPKIGDVIITTEAPMGNVAQIDRDKIALAQRVIKYRGKNGLMDNDYLKQALLSKLFQDELNKRATGGTVKGIKGSVLHTLSLPVPCLEEQQKIADFLSAYDEAIARAKQELDKWRELKKGLLQQMFV